MIRLVLIAALAVAAHAAFAQPEAPETTTWISATPAREGWFLCDAIAGPYAAFAGKPDATGSSLITLLDRRTGRFDTQSYLVGAPDPGAGQIYWSLSKGGREIGNVHGVNPGMIEEGGATIAPITGVSINGQQLECRWLAHMRFIGLNSRRSIAIAETPQGLVYESFDYRGRGAVTRPDGVQRSNAPTLRIVGGGAETTGGYRFTNKGYVYVVAVPAGGGAAKIEVAHSGRPIGSDALVGYTRAMPTTAASITTPVFGADSVWSGQDLDGCRAKQSTAEIDTCIVATMRRTGASPAAILFTQRLIAKRQPGYVSAWKQAGPIGIATVTYPFRANTNEGTWLIPAIGEPIDADSYMLTAADKARADYRAAQAQHPDAFPVPPGVVSLDKMPDGMGTRILVTTPTADCHACAPNGSVVIAFDFDDAGHFLRAGLVLAA